MIVPTPPLAVTGTLDGFAAWLGEGAPLRIALVVLAAIVLTVVARRLIRRGVRRIIARSATRHPERTEAREPALGTTRMAQRAQAIGALMTGVVLLLIWVNALLVVLELLGINVTPLIASAGVVGVALAFGAQTLVKDYLAGIFIIIEDQYGIGDEVRFDAVTGVVEEVALRTTTVRDPEGVLWYLRNGEILNVANRSQGRGGGA
jgi:small conductance mechanosensitive channel